jgi:acyl-CoA synthetase (AMP-forming)/AMP-acid ligase II
MSGPADAEHPFVPMNRKNYGYSENAIYLSPAPIYHTAPLVSCMVVHRIGGTVVIMDHFTPEVALEAIERYRVTHTQMVPTMFVRMLKMPEDQRPASRLVLLAGRHPRRCALPHIGQAADRKYSLKRFSLFSQGTPHPDSTSGQMIRCETSDWFRFLLQNDLPVEHFALPLLMCGSAVLEFRHDAAGEQVK